jgi:hypothetical protein
VAIDKEDILQLQNILDDRYVLQKDCNDKQESVNNKFANDDTRIKLFEQKMKSWERLFKLIATGTIGTLLTSILSLVLK